MPAKVTSPTPLERAARPLLRLAQQLTGFESIFVSSICWNEARQRVLFAFNSGGLALKEGSSLDWHDAICHESFRSGKAGSFEACLDVPSTPDAVALGIRSFCLVPILVSDGAIATICGASLGEIALTESQVEGMRLIAASLQQLLEVESERCLADARFALAERETLDARDEAVRLASGSQLVHRLAQTDSLTGLSNRLAFVGRWNAESARSGSRHYPIALILIDTHHLKQVSDEFGRSKGEAVLRAIGAALLAVASPADIVARLDGDEFALVTTHADGPRLVALAAEIQRCFAAMAGELGVGTTLSMGIVSSDDCPREGMLAAADLALVRCRAAAGNDPEIFVKTGVSSNDAA